MCPNNTQTDLPPMVRQTALSCISLDTQQCDPAALNNWLCDLAQQVEYLKQYVVDNNRLISGLVSRQDCLEHNLVELEKRVKTNEGKIKTLEGKVATLENRLNTQNDLLSQSQNAFDQFRNWLPCGNTGTIPSNWVFVMAERQDAFDGTCPTLKPKIPKLLKLLRILPEDIDQIISKNQKLAVGNINITSGGYTGNLGLFTRAKNQDGDLDFA